jgi:hypothetical protein
MEVRMSSFENSTLASAIGRHSEHWTFFCPLCKRQRSLPQRPEPYRARHILQITLTAATFTLLTWSWFNWRGMVSFLPFWVIFELVYRSRARAAMRCRHCGFDPFLYLTDLPRAQREVEEHWKQKFAEKGIPYPEKKPPPAQS